MINSAGRESQQKEFKEAQVVLGTWVTNRPTPEQLVEKKVIPGM